MNKQKFEEACDKVIEKIRNMSKEEIEKEVFKLNGTMTEYLFNKVIDEIIKKRYIISEDLLYDYSYKYNITEKEFNDVFNYLDATYKKYRENVTKYFPEYKFYFNYKNNNFCWRLLMGQGSSYQLYLIDDIKNKNIIKIKKIDTKIKFFKDLDET